MEWLEHAAAWLRHLLFGQPWLAAWRSTIASTPDWALVGAAPFLLLLLVLLTWVLSPRTTPERERPLRAPTAEPGGYAANRSDTGAGSSEAPVQAALVAIPEGEGDAPAGQSVEPEEIVVWAVSSSGEVWREPPRPPGDLIDFETLLPLGDGDPSDVWGAKWNASRGRLAGDPANGFIDIWFDTPWGIVKPVLSAIAVQYPRLRATGAAFDEGWNFAARIAIGEGKAEIVEGEATAQLHWLVFQKGPSLAAPKADGDQQDDDDSDAYETDFDDFDDLDDDDAGGDRAEDEEDPETEPSEGPREGGVATDRPLIRPLIRLLSVWRDKIGSEAQIIVSDDGGHGELATPIDAPETRYVAALAADEGARRIAIRLASPIAAAPDRLSDLYVLINAINQRLDLGGMTVSSEGEAQRVQWRSALLGEADQLSIGQIDEVLQNGIGALGAWAKALTAVARDGKSAEEALLLYQAEQGTSSP